MRKFFGVIGLVLFVLALMLVAAAFADPQQTGIIITAGAVKLIWAVVAAAALFLLLRLRDRLVGVDFRVVAEGIAGDPKASAIYYGLSVLAVAYLLGELLS